MKPETIVVIICLMVFLAWLVKWVVVIRDARQREERRRARWRLAGLVGEGKRKAEALRDAHGPAVAGGANERKGGRK